MINPKSKVGKVFEKRDMVKVVRHPPTPDELQNPLRFVAVGPESSAIFPVRGPLAIEPPPVASRIRCDERTLQSPVSEDRIEEDVRAQKRQKIGVSSWQNPPNLDIADPQRSKRTDSCTDNLFKAYEVIDREGDSNGYETSASSYAIGLSAPILHKSSSAIIIPDSPRQRTRRTLKSNGVDLDTSDSEIYAPRAESPELTSTPPSYLRQVADSAPSSQVNVDSSDHEAHPDAALVVSIPLPVTFSKSEDHPASLGDHDMALSGGILLEATPPLSPKIVPPPPRVAPLPSTRSNSSLNDIAGSSLKSTPDNSFDPISTDTENPHSKSWLSGFKRLKTKSKRPPTSPQVVSTQHKDSVGAAEKFIPSSLLGQKAENLISQNSSASTKRDSKDLHNPPRPDFVQFVEPVTLNEDTANPILLEKKAELQVPSEPSGTITQKPPQISPADPVTMSESTVKPIPPEVRVERQVPSESSASIAKGLPQHLPEEPVNVNKATLRSTAPERKEGPRIPSKPSRKVTKDYPRLPTKGGPSYPQNPVNKIEETVMLKPSGKEVEAGTPSASTPSTKAKRKDYPRLPTKGGPSYPQNPVNKIEETVMLKPSGKEVEAGTPSASTPSTKAKRKRLETLPQADYPRSQKVASSAEVAVKVKPSDTKVGSTIPLGFTGNTNVKISQLQPSSQASPARTEEPMPVAESAVQSAAPNEMQDVAPAESPRLEEIKPKANRSKRTTKKPNRAAAGEKISLDRNAEKSVHKSVNSPKLAKAEKPNLNVIQPEQKVEEARITDTRPETNTLHEIVGAKEDELVNLTAISLPQSSLRRSKRTQPTRERIGPGHDPSEDISGDFGAPAKRKEPNRTQKPSKLAVLNVKTEQSPQDWSRWVAVNSATKVDKASAEAVDTRVLSEPSSPRGPAQYMSRPHSAGSFSSVSSSGSDSDSQDDMVLLRQAVTPAKIKPEQSIKSLGRHVSKNRALANTEGSIGKGSVPKTRQSPISISSSNHNSSKGTTEEAENHLSLKPRRDVLIADSPLRGRKAASSIPVSRPLDDSVKSKSILNEKSTPVPSTANSQGERPYSSAPGASRPINSRYPSMTDLIRQPPPTEQSRPGQVSSSISAANAGETGALSFHGLSGSSSSETSSSEEDN